MSWKGLRIERREAAEARGSGGLGDCQHSASAPVLAVAPLRAEAGDWGSGPRPAVGAAVDLLEMREVAADVDDLLAEVLKGKVLADFQGPLIPIDAEKRNLVTSKKSINHVRRDDENSILLDELADGVISSKPFEFDDHRNTDGASSKVPEIMVQKDMDFSELNFLTLHIDPISDGLLTVDLLPFLTADNSGSREAQLDGLLPMQDEISSEPETSSIESLQTPSNPQTPIEDAVSPANVETMSSVLQTSSLESSTPTKIPVSTIMHLPEKTAEQLPCDSDKESISFDAKQISRQILKLLSTKTSVTNGTNVLKEASNGSSQSASSKCLEAKPMAAKSASSNTIATITISTDKDKNTTRIVISSSQGDQAFLVKSSDLMKTAGSIEKIGNRKMKMINMSEKEETDKHQEEELEGDDHRALQDVNITFEEEDDGFLDVPHRSLNGMGIAAENLNSTVHSNGQKFWMCPKLNCGEMFPKQSVLKAHIQNHHGSRPFRCNVEGCCWSFFTYFKLKRHMETHLKKKEFLCADCNRSFTTIYNLKSHKKLHLRPAAMICNVAGCGAKFQTKRDLEAHMKQHENLEAPYKCPVEGCEKTYFTMNSLTSHCRSHQHKEEEVKCSWVGCGRVFDRPCRLRTHLHSHTGDRPFACTFQGCTWSFSSVSKLRRHQRKHTNERRYECSVNGCGKSFLRADHLKGHMLTHMGVKKFRCPATDCGARFAAKSSLYVHLKRHGSSNEKVTYHCPINHCARKYLGKASLRQHILKDHSPDPNKSSPTQLDYITLLTADDDIAYEALVSTAECPTEVESDVLNTSSVSFACCDLSSPEKPGLVSPSEFIADNVGYHHLLGNTHLTNGVITEILLAPEVHQPQEAKCSSPCKISESKEVMTSNEAAPVLLPSPSDALVASSVNSTVTSPVHGEEIVEPVFVDVETFSEGCPSAIATSSLNGGAARTNLTYQEFLKGREKKRQHLVQKLGPQTGLSPTNSPLLLSEPSHSLAGVGISSDVVLTSGVITCQEPLPSTMSIHPNHILQDELSSTQDLYSNDNLMSLGGGPPEFQVLLLPDSASSRDDFPESTINLRDLE